MAYNPPPHYSFGEPVEPQQPPSAPPQYGSPPQSAPPSYMSQPQSAPPSYSPGGAPAGYVPTQPAPTQFTQPMLVPGPPPERRSPVVPILGVVTVIGFAAAALSLALWLRADGDLSDANAQLDDRDAEIAQLREDLDAAETQVSELEVQAADAESMRACLDDLAWFWATPEGSEEETQAWVAVSDSCATWLF
ncbi:hypothetical protein SAMN05216298_1393 [Glycomyces sambucus]|uniref:Uncharacterized protein n=1 Tax=Glycomyces sambucus TaxID=380244 RepID=A0A1G9ETJ7_9ACTN|nr:hypothetical protein [Glycomyces sambucus]SDK79497.1 hypothetical protein SAMN05216298_1393 [Glycomyces sambucus]